MAEVKQEKPVNDPNRKEPTSACVPGNAVSEADANVIELAAKNFSRQVACTIKHARDVRITHNKKIWLFSFCIFKNPHLSGKKKETLECFESVNETRKYLIEDVNKACDFCLEKVQENFEVTT